MSAHQYRPWTLNGWSPACPLVGVEVAGSTASEDDADAVGGAMPKALAMLGLRTGGGCAGSDGTSEVAASLTSQGAGAG